MYEPADVVLRFLAGVEARDIDVVISCFAVDGRWQNVPHPPAIGRDAVRAMLAPILSKSSAVVWDVVNEAYSPGRAWLERVDRFWIDGTEYAVRCNGVLDIDTDTGLITDLRDYVDLGEWRARLTVADL